MRLFSPRLGKPLKQVCRNLSRLDMTEGGAIYPDRRAGVSRGHSRCLAGEASEALLGRKVEKLIGGAGNQEAEGPNG